MVVPESSIKSRNSTLWIKFVSHEIHLKILEKSLQFVFAKQFHAVMCAVELWSRHRYPIRIPIDAEIYSIQIGSKYKMSTEFEHEH